MYKNVLVVFSQQETALRDGIENEIDGLQDSQGRSVVVYTAKDRAGALIRQTQNDVHFSIVGHALAGGPRSPVEEDGGMRLSEELRRRGVETPIILVLPHVSTLTNSMLMTCGALGVQPLHTGDELIGMIRHQIQRYRPPLKMLEIRLTASHASTWTYVLLGNNFQYNRTGEVELPTDLLERAVDLTETIAIAPVDDWYRWFQKLGQALTTGMCDRTKFGVELEMGLELAGGIERARISFAFPSFDNSHYPIALEALFPPKRFPEIPWMVRAPLYRSAGSLHSLGKPLFGQGVSRLKVLVAGVNAHGFVNSLTNVRGDVLELKSLSGVERECKGVQRLLKERDRSQLIDKVSVLEGNGQGRLSKKRFLEELESTDWSIVHFAGHSLARKVADKERRGYLFVGGPDQPEVVEIDEISAVLRRTTLVYLSSCESSDPAFAIELARYVPIVIGFRWKVDDMFAALHAHLFYKFLFEERRVETAFLQTRRAIHRRFSTAERAWASSMLVFGEVH